MAYSAYKSKRRSQQGASGSGSRRSYYAPGNTNNQSHQSHDDHERSGPSLVGILIKIVLGCIVLGGIVLWRLWHQIHSDVSLPSERKTITVNEGDSFKTVIDRTFDKKVARDFALYTKFHPQSIELSPGTYTMPDSPIAKQDLIDGLLTEPAYVTRPTRIIEGRSSYDTDHALARQGFIQTGQYIAAAQRAYTGSVTGRDLGTSPSSLEGFLYPDTYNVASDLRDEALVNQLIDMQLRAFASRISSNIDTAQLDELNTRLGTDLSMYDALTMASIVRNEERVETNKQGVASVLLRRITSNDRIGADITICYGLQLRLDQCHSNLTRANIDDTSNPYNTRANRGIPPTPIGSFLLADLQAVLDATTTPHYYYLHDSTGQIHFARTTDEHNANKAKYIK